MWADSSNAYVQTIPKITRKGPRRESDTETDPKLINRGCDSQKRRDGQHGEIRENGKTPASVLFHPLNEKETKLLSSLHVGGKRAKRGGKGNRKYILEANHGGSRIYNCQFI